MDKWKLLYISTDHTVKVLIPPVRAWKSYVLDHLSTHLLPVLLHILTSIPRLHAGQFLRHCIPQFNG